MAIPTKNKAPEPAEILPPKGASAYFTARNGSHRDVWRMDWDGKNATFTRIGESMLSVDAFARCHLLQTSSRMNGDV